MYLCLYEYALLCREPLVCCSYPAFADAHLRELIQRYKPDILWDDINYPKSGKLLEILADYFNEFPEGTFNGSLLLKTARG